MTQQNNEMTQSLLNEIFLKPSNEIKVDRFAETSEAKCSGGCASPSGCKAFV